MMGLPVGAERMPIDTDLTVVALEEAVLRAASTLLRELHIGPALRIQAIEVLKSVGGGMVGCQPSPSFSLIVHDEIIDETWWIVANGKAVGCKGS